MAHTLYDEALEQPPEADRLRAMIRALASGDELGQDMRTEIINALKRHEVRRENDKLRAMRGRSIEHGVWFAATIAKHLVDHCNAPVKVAVITAIESFSEQQGLDPLFDASKVTRAYQKLNKSPDGFIATADGGKFCVSQITQPWLDDAVKRLAGKACSDGAPKEINLIVDRLGYESVTFITYIGAAAGANGVIVMLSNP